MIRLLINADDFGISSEVNEAIKECFSKELINRTSIMVNMPAYNEAIEIAKVCNFKDKVGLHINIMEGNPLTEDIKHTLFCTNGVFNGEVFKKTVNRFWLNKNTRKALEKEIRAQIEKYLEDGFCLKHIDSHEHSHTNYSVMNVLNPLLHEYEFKSVRLSRNIPHKKIRGMKRVYKKFFNWKIIKFNSKSGNETSRIKAFGGLEDIQQLIYNEEHYKIIELMVHPIMISGKIEDGIKRIGIENWLSTQKYNIKW
ncbi:MAG: ChbG/HpnK family deacetylase [Dorea sp.]|nr:ChbG/HpnK family deacetylase [Dorea sp.]